MSDGVESGNACEAAGPATVWEVGKWRWWRMIVEGGICLLSSISILYIYIDAYVKPLIC